MSGHSKWATTKRQKEATDAKRSGLFTKLSKTIAVAAREGADPATNFKLRMAIDAARSFSMPKDNIERAIARGSGTGDAVTLETVIYEAFGPGGIGIMIEAITDNKNRAVSEVKHVLSKYGGNLGGTGSVAWMFDARGLVIVSASKLTDEHELELIDAGALDIKPADDSTTIVTELESLQAVEARAQKLGLSVAEAGTGFVAKELTKPADPDTTRKLLEALDELDDVNALYTNADL